MDLAAAVCRAARVAKGCRRADRSTEGCAGRGQAGEQSDLLGAGDSCDCNGNEFDARLEPLRPQLKGQAFQSFSRFSLIKQHELSIAGGASQNFEVPGEHQGVLSYEGRADSGGKQRLRLRLEIQDGAAKLLSTKFVINDGGTVMQAGMKYDKGVLVLGITCRIAS